MSTHSTELGAPTPANPIEMAPEPSPSPHLELSQIEESHVEQALSASETAILAIDTLLNISMWTLGILAIVLAVIGIIGWSVIKTACVDKVKQIANKRFNSYIQSDDFHTFVQARVDKAVKANWQNHLMKRIQEAVKEDDDPSPFPEKDEKK